MSSAHCQRLIYASSTSSPFIVTVPDDWLSEWVSANASVSVDKSIRFDPAPTNGPSPNTRVHPAVTLFLSLSLSSSLLLRLLWTKELIACHLFSNIRNLVVVVSSSSPLFSAMGCCVRLAQRRFRVFFSSLSLLFFLYVYMCLSSNNHHSSSLSLFWLQCYSRLERRVKDVEAVRIAWDDLN